MSDIKKEALKSPLVFSYHVKLSTYQGTNIKAVMLSLHRIVSLFFLHLAMG